MLPSKTKHLKNNGNQIPRDECIEDTKYRPDGYVKLVCHFSIIFSRFGIAVSIIYKTVRE